MKKIVKNVINKLSTIDFDLTKNYKLSRNFNKIMHFHYFGFLYKKINTKININNSNINLRIFFPKNNYTKAIIYFHGGGFVEGSIQTYDKLCSKLATETNCAVIAVDYSLAPEHPFPKAIEECYSILKEIIINKNIIDISKDNIILMGDSAGGNIAAVVSLMAKDKNEFQIKKQILLYPVIQTNHTKTSKYKSVLENGNDWLLTNKKMNDYFKLYVTNKKDLKNKYVSPILSNNLSKQPKTLIIVAELDPLRDEGIEYGEKLKKFENDVEIHLIKDAIHGFFNYTFFKNEISEVYKYINNFINK